MPSLQNFIPAPPSSHLDQSSLTFSDHRAPVAYSFYRCNRLSVALFEPQSRAEGGKYHPVAALKAPFDSVSFPSTTLHSARVSLTQRALLRVYKLSSLLGRHVVSAEVYVDVVSGSSVLPQRDERQSSYGVLRRLAGLPKVAKLRQTLQIGCFTDNSKVHVAASRMSDATRHGQLGSPLCWVLRIVVPSNYSSSLSSPAVDHRFQQERQVTLRLVQSTTHPA
jgi:hypothetical protein